MSGGIGVIVNPYSRKNRKNPEAIKKLGYIIGDKGSCEATRSLSDVERVAREFMKKGVEILALSGGDGTNHITLTTFINVYGDHPLPKIALLRGGTMNTIAESVGVKGTTDTILFNIVEKYHTGRPFEVAKNLVVKIGDRYGFLFGNGCVHGYLAEYYATGKPSPWRAVTTLSRGAASALVDGDLSRRIFRRFKARVWVDGVKWEEEDYFSVLAASIEQLGLGFKPFVAARGNPGCFTVLGVKGTAADVTMALPNIKFGRPMNPKVFNSFPAKHVVFETEEPLKYTIDGDIYEAGTRLELASGPELELIIS
ncbi:MAG: diacylglycerol kinase family protein [Myxococcota bacterium]|jgi:diacylglycerol kinase family enzyme